LSSTDFHTRIARLAAIEPGNRVLDLGCGRGSGLPALLDAVGDTGKLIAADRDQAALNAIREAHGAEIDRGLLTIMACDFARDLPFDAASFDVVACQNVVECVADRAGLVAAIHRILRPGGTALIGHHDFDGVLIASDDRDLSRRLIHGYADFTDSWQDTSDGQMGRRLPGLCAQAAFADTATETVLFVDLTLGEGTYAKRHIDNIVHLSGRFGIDEAVAKKWQHDLETRSTAGTFYYGLPWTYVVARR
jgi:SAM-dependent methyltransferase